MPGTRPEYTAVSDHYRVDINLEPPSLDGATWRLPVDGQVSNPLSLTLDQIRSGYRSQDLFATLSCISNPLGGSLIGTTLWTGVPFRDILAQAQPLPSAHYAHITAADGFDEVVEIATAEADPRIMLVYEWNGEPIPEKHGYPLRIFIPDLYGMKQPKWITGINLVPDFINGYWVVRGWDKTASMKTTSVIDTVATDSIDIRGGRTYVPIGGIAHAGERGISKVEVQVDGGEWEEAELRQPLSQLTWVIWRYDWPFAEGNHRFAVRATDGQGQLQEAESQPVFPSGATGIYEKTAEISPRVAGRDGDEEAAAVSSHSGRLCRVRPRSARDGRSDRHAERDRHEHDRRRRGKRCRLRERQVRRGHRQHELGRRAGAGRDRQQPYRFGLCRSVSAGQAALHQDKPVRDARCWSRRPSACRARKWHLVTGATVTSEGFIESLKNALSQAGG